MAAGLAEPSDLLRAPLLRSYRPQDWPAWFKAAGLEAVNVRGPLFDSSVVMTQAAMRGVNAAVVGLLGAALYSPVWTTSVKTPADFGVALIGFVLLVAWRAPPLLVVAISALAGIGIAWGSL